MDRGGRRAGVRSPRDPNPARLWDKRAFGLTGGNSADQVRRPPVAHGQVPRAGGARLRSRVRARGPQHRGGGARMKLRVERLQPLGRALMLPIAVLPIAALLLRLGQSDMLDIAFV